MRRVILLRVGDQTPSDLIGLPEAAKILKISRSTLYEAIKAGKITVYVREWDLRQQVSRAEVERLAAYRPKRDPGAQAGS
jgi:predicted site-specific integrase-resolvase